jgi:hypothetical protein
MESELDMCCWLAPSQRNVYLNLYLIRVSGHIENRLTFQYGYMKIMAVMMEKFVRKQRFVIIKEE